jgi:hypothetical protein
MNCTRCEGTGFLNVEQLPEDLKQDGIDCDKVLKWIAENDGHDVQVCDCCGDGHGWYNEPGSHNHNDYGKNGPYAYNGGLPECY